MPWLRRSARPSVPIVAVKARTSYSCSGFRGGRYGGAMEVRIPETPLSDGAVTLSPWTLDDAADIVAALDGDPEIAHWMHQIPQPYTEADARAYVSASGVAWRAGTGATFAVRDESGTVTGSLGMRVIDAEDDVVEVGYWTAARARRRGLTTRALALLCRWLFDEVGAARVQLRADVLN